jgi:dUTP pyrophosphatase
MHIKFIRTDDRAVMPEYKTEGSAAFDVRAILDAPLVMGPGYLAMIRTGLKIWLADHRYCIQIIPRSGTGTKGLVLGNGTGLIDSDYQGEIFVPLLNRSGEEMTVCHGDRIAQAIIVPVLKPSFVEVAYWEEQTQRGAGGFGSTGM